MNFDDFVLFQGTVNIVSFHDLFNKVCQKFLVLHWIHSISEIYINFLTVSVKIEQRHHAIEKIK
jgi:hypothetical protein